MSDRESVSMGPVAWWVPLCLAGGHRSPTRGAKSRSCERLRAGASEPKGGTNTINERDDDARTMTAFIPGSRLQPSLHFDGI